MAQYDEMIADGWCSALFYESEDVELSIWLSDMRAALSDVGIDMPDTIVFGTDVDYSISLDDILVNYGIDHAVNYGNDDYPLLETTAEDGVWHPGACGWITGGVTSVMYNSVKRDGGHFVFTVGFDRSGYRHENYDPNDGTVSDQFVRMINTVKSAVGNELIVYSDLDLAKQYRKEYNVLVLDAIERANAQKLLIEAQIAEIDGEMLAVYEKYYG